MDIGFERLKQEVEAELDRPIEQGEEIAMKGLYYFGKGLKLKSQLESEPKRIGEILPQAMQNIIRRCEQNPNNKAFSPTASKHRQGVISAVRDFMFDRPNRNKKPKEKLLF